VAPVADVLDFERHFNEHAGVLPLPFPGMDKVRSAVCEFYVRSSCSKAAACPFRHDKCDKTVVCKHWLRGLCKKGDGCEFLHVFDESKMPECYFYSRFNACHNKECPFQHIDPESKIIDCPWYNRGFCRHGPTCRHRHVRRVLCLNYLTGFCPAGPDCKDAHPRFEIPAPPDHDPTRAKSVVITCHFCGGVGHKMSHCSQMTPEQKERHMASMRSIHEVKVYNGYAQGGHNFVRRGGGGGGGGPYNGRSYTTAGGGGGSSAEGGGKPEGGVKLRNLEDVMCYKCGDKGHYANRCTKGHLAFLSLQSNQNSMRNSQNNGS